MGFSRFFSLFLFCLIIVSCHEEKKNANINVQLDDLADWNIRKYSLSSRKIRHDIDSLRLLPLRMYADEYTRKYYASGAPFLWITRSGIDEKADTLLAYLQKASSSGLRESNFYISELQTNLRRIRQLDFDPENNINAVFGRTEFLLTKAYLRYVCGQRFGYVQPNQIFNRLEQTDTTQKAPFRRLYDIETESADQEFVHKALSLLKDGNFTDFFQDIQPDNPLYRQLTDHYLQTQNPETRRKTIVNIERSRWRTPLAAHNKYVWVNLAAATLYAIDENKPEYLDMKICIGSPKNKTPMLQSRIERVDMNPYWNIPYSIVKKEIAPRHAGDEAYFSRNRYRIFNKETGEELPPAAVTSGMLTSGRYRVRQDNGEGNSLGRLIFRFPNNFSIYLHDTNNRQAFKRTNRAISHGCIRIEKPLELAVFLLDSPEEKTVNKLREAIGLPPLNSSVPIEKKEGEQLKVGIQRFDPSIPVVIDYYTLYPKPDGEWEESPDPYGYDEILLKKLEAF